jgi:hypothetical protein
VALDRNRKFFNGDGDESAFFAVHSHLENPPGGKLVSRATVRFRPVLRTGCIPSFERQRRGALNVRRATLGVCGSAGLRALSTTILMSVISIFCKPMCSFSNILYKDGIVAVYY